MVPAQLQATLELLPEAHLLVALDGMVVACNREAERMLGASLGGRRLQSVVRDGDRAERLVARWSRSTGLLPGALTTRGEPPEKLRCEGALLGPATDHGERPLVLVRLRPHREAASPFLALNERIEALQAEIVRRQTVEGELADEREWLSVLLSSIGDGVIAIDADGRVTLMNPAASRYSGWTSAEAQGRPLSEVFVIINEHTREPAELPVDRVLREGIVVGLANHTLLVRRDGTELAIADSAAPIRDAAGRLHGVVIVFQDETVRRFNESTRRRLLEREKQARQQAEEVSRLKDEFFAILSHELRTPLNAVVGWADMLAEGNASSDQLDHGLAVIQRNAKAQVALVDQLIEAARIATGRLDLKLQNLDVRAVVREACETLGHAARAKGISLAVDGPREELALVADPLRLRQAVWNLVSNALKFTPTGRTVWVHCRRNESRIEIEVKDEGIGLEPHQIEQVFQPFWQADGTRSGSERGLGLGLAIVLRVTEAHGGRVHVSSPGCGRGTSFVIELPVRATLPDAASSHEWRGEEVDAPAHRVRLDGIGVLVVEDEPDSRELIRVVLGARGADTRTAADGAEALAMLDDWLPDVLLSDVAMPRMDGYELMRRVRDRARDQGGHVAAAALTAFAGEVDRKRASEAGFDVHLAKPIRPNDLVEAVANLAELSRERSR